MPTKNFLPTSVGIDSLAQFDRVATEASEKGAAKGAAKGTASQKAGSEATLKADSYLTISEPTQVASRERSSKFLAYAFPVQCEEQIRDHLETLHKRHYDATHICYAWRLGPNGENFRANDDGEPSGTAGKPILGQLLSNSVTDVLVAVVRYFGGTKLGVAGLIAAYRESASEAIEATTIEERTVDRQIRLCFPYIVMNDIMRVIKEEQPTIVEQQFDNLCTMHITIREGSANLLLGKLKKAGATITDGAEEMA